MAVGYRQFILATLLAVIVSTSSCGVRPPFQSPDAQPVGRVVLPDADPISLSLTGANGSDRHFNGWFIIWDPAATAAMMARVLKATVEFHRAYATHLRWYADTVAPLREKALLLGSQCDELTGTINRNLLPNRLSLASQWFVRRQQDSQLNLSEDDREKSSKVFDSFCEAKIWEFTTNREFISRLYAKRPTPAALCEQYYRDHGFFSESNSACVADGRAKDFFACLWNSGVMRTAAMGRAKDFPALSALDAAVVKDSILNRLISQSILRQGRAIRVGDRMFDLSFVGQKTISDTDASIDALVPTGILQIFAIGSLSDVPSDSIRLVSLVPTRDSANLAAIEEWRRDVGVFSGSINDREFNAPLADDSTVASFHSETSQSDSVSQCSAAGGKGVCSILAATDREAQDRLQKLKAEIADIKSETIRLTTKADEPCAANREVDSLQCREEQASLRLSESVTAPGATVVMLPLQRFSFASFSIPGPAVDAGPTHSGAGVRFAFAQGNPRIPFLCGGIDGSVAAAESGCASESTHLTIDRPTVGALNIQSVAPVPFAQYGLLPMPRSDDPHRPEFVEIPSNFGDRGEMKFELAANRWESVLDIISGPVTISSSGGAEDLHGVVLLLDADVTKETIKGTHD